MRKLSGLALVFLIGCQKAVVPGGTAQMPADKASPAGWEVRYNAALALALRGSPKAGEPGIQDTLLEMLDEPRQLRNFRAKMRDGSEVADETAARLTVIAALKAIAELHRQQPAIDLSVFAAPIAKLSESDVAPVRTEAKAARVALDAK